MAVVPSSDTEKTIPDTGSGSDYRRINKDCNQITHSFVLPRLLVLDHLSSVVDQQVREQGV